MDVFRLADAGRGRDHHASGIFLSDLPIKTPAAFDQNAAKNFPEFGWHPGRPLAFHVDTGVGA
jgi:hypothetical protein